MTHLQCANRRLALDEPVVMGVLNVTPDSFSDGGQHDRLDAALAHARRMVGEGAGIIDVGGESTRPGASPVPLQQELDRVIPVVEALVATLDVVVSVDTSRPEVIIAATRAGATLVNDVRGLTRPGALAAAAASGAAVCVMHMRGEPETMQDAPRYDDVVAEVRGWLADRLQACHAAGIGADRCLADPGFGFGKTLEHNLALLARLPEALPPGVPALVGLSRKSMVGALTGRPVAERLPGSLAAATLAVWQGAAIIRAHDVAATVDAVKVAAAVRRRTL